MSSIMVAPLSNLLGIKKKKREGRKGSEKMYESSCLTMRTDSEVS